jgi:outer membrane lipoprotein SlyB
MERIATEREIAGVHGAAGTHLNSIPRSRNMKRQWIATTLAASALVVAAGCATYDGPQEYSTRDERVVQSVTYGTVESVRAVRLDQHDAPVGTVAGAAVGGILGSQVGHGAGSAVGAILGAVGGGLAGNAIEHGVTEHQGEEVVVRLDNGSTIAVVQGGPEDLRPGDRVRVLNGARGARVERV